MCLEVWEEGYILVFLFLLVFFFAIVTIGLRLFFSFFCMSYFSLSLGSKKEGGGGVFMMIG